MLKIGPITLGFTTNSSSLHGIVQIISGVGKIKDSMRFDDFFDYGISYGRETFTLASPSQKALYLAVQLHSYLKYKIGEELSCIVVKELVNVDFQAFFKKTRESFPSFENYKTEFLEDFGDFPSYRLPENEKLILEYYQKAKEKSFQEWLSYASVDHQSTWSFPRKYEDRHSAVDLDFVEDLQKFLFREDIFILGGSDEDDCQPYRERTPEEIEERQKDHLRRLAFLEKTKKKEAENDEKRKIAESKGGQYLEEFEIEEFDQKHKFDPDQYADPFPWEANSLEAGGHSSNINLPLTVGDAVCRKDDVYNYWTVFNQNTGAILRMSFDPQAPEIQQASVPEIVDLCITTKCNTACPWCFMDSKKEGQDVSDNDIYSIINVLRKNKVFEVAIGGGEPTLHPKFFNNLSTFVYDGIIPNFSTRSTEWMNDPAKVGKVIENVGNFAFSVSTGKQLLDVYALAAKVGLNGKLAFHYILGTGELDAILYAASIRNVPVTLLGFKSNGRGACFLEKMSAQQKKEMMGGWLDTVSEAKEKNRCPRVGVDSAIVEQFREQIEEKLKVSRYFLSPSDGKFSMFINGVNKTYGRSSFDPESYKIDDFRDFDLKEAFLKFQKESKKENTEIFPGD